LSAAPAMPRPFWFSVSQRRRRAFSARRWAQPACRPREGRPPLPRARDVQRPRCAASCAQTGCLRERGRVPAMPDADAWLSV
jgi:hypothetical protein